MLSVGMDEYERIDEIYARVKRWALEFMMVPLIRHFAGQCRTEATDRFDI